MQMWTRLIAASLGVLALSAVPQAQNGATTPTLTDQDYKEIRELVARYARALGSCEARDYSELFTPDGVFVSDDFRGAKHREMYGKSGKLEGRAALFQLVQTEEHCLKGEPRANANRPVPEVIIEPTAGGARGRASLGRAGGHYEDVYVKTAEGWRFKQRTVFMPPSPAAAPASPGR